MGGSLRSAGAKDLYEEGLMIPSIKLIFSGVVNNMLFSTIEANVRVSRQTSGDIRVQLAANEQGNRSLKRLMDENDMEVNT